MNKLPPEHPFAQRHAQGKPKAKIYRRPVCDCGRPAVVMFAACFICERCYKLDSFAEQCTADRENQEDLKGWLRRLCNEEKARDEIALIRQRYDSFWNKRGMNPPGVSHSFIDMVEQHEKQIITAC